MSPKGTTGRHGVTDWKARIKQLLDQPSGPGGNDPFLATIKEFVATLDENRWLHAQLEQGSAPSIQSIILTPKIRRSERNVLLSFWVTPYWVSVGGEQSTGFQEPEGLQRFFVEFVRRSGLLSTVKDYQELCLAPVKAALRTSDAVPHGRGDITVVVEPADQNKLAQAVDAEHSDVITIQVVPMENGGCCDRQAEYSVLDSAGIGLSLTEGPELTDGGALRLTGIAFVPRQSNGLALPQSARATSSAERTAVRKDLRAKKEPVGSGAAPRRRRAATSR